MRIIVREANGQHYLILSNSMVAPGPADFSLASFNPVVAHSPNFPGKLSYSAAPILKLVQSFYVPMPEKMSMVSVGRSLELLRLS